MPVNDREKLINLLYDELENEVLKPETEMDTEKIRNINDLLAKLEVKDIPDELHKDIFLKNFEQKYQIGIRKRTVQKKHRGKMLQAAALLLMCFVLGNSLCVKALDKNIFQIIGQTTHSIMFRARGVEEDLNVNELKDDSLSLWKEAKEEFSGILIPGELPEGWQLDGVELLSKENLIKARYVNPVSAKELWYYIYSAAEKSLLLNLGEGWDEAEELEVAGKQLTLLAREEEQEAYFRQDAYLYFFTGDCEKEDILLFAKSLKE